jgi:two-component system OmpR family sensor kinase
MSLRTRLLAGIVVLVVTGLSVAAAVTYAEQRSFLQGRVDQQVASARFPIITVLGLRDGVHPFGRPPGGFPRRRGARPRGGLADLPPGTFGEMIGPGGRVIGEPVSLAYTGTRVKAPALPARYPVSGAGASPREFTFADYKAAAVRVPDGTVIVAVPLREVNETLHRLIVVELLVGAGVVAGLLVLGWFVIGVGLRPLERIRRVASEISHGDLTRRVSPATDRTEVGRLGASLNEMLAQIERAFAARTASEERLRRFLADASHELRTPLAAIRGYAELHRMGAAADPDAVSRSMTRIEAEATRMGRLVEDLLTLARLGELPVSEQRPVDLAELAAHAVGDARAMAPGHPVSLEASGQAWVLGDPDGLRQVLANLLRNAVIHTPDGTPVTVRVEASEGEVRLEVRDLGPGLPGGVGDEVYERFWRSEGGRSRGPGGAGLGLAIVKAIVDAHHGHVHVSGAEGEGACFRIRLASAPSADSANAQAPHTQLLHGPGTVSRS